MSADSARHGGGLTLLAVLANPTLTPRSRTERQVEVAAQLLGFEVVELGNVFNIPSPSSRDISHLGAAETGWVSARENLEDALRRADGVLVAFGSINASGTARVHLAAQLDWLSSRLQASPALDTWQVGSARHPSRWHQYVSDVHGRTAGGSFPQRLAQVLHPVPLQRRVWDVARSTVRPVELESSRRQCPSS